MENNHQDKQKEVPNGCNTVSTVAVVKKEDSLMRIYKHLKFLFLNGQDLITTM